jgi:diguanylate cyclase (GGDEF)-like protein
VLALGLGAIAVIAVLQHRSVESREAELKLATVKTQLSALQGAPFRSARATGGSPRLAAALMRTGKTGIVRNLGELLRESPPAALRRVSAPMRANFAALDRIYRIGVATGEFGRRADQTAATAARENAITFGLLDQARREYARDAMRSSTEAQVGSTAAILLLLAAFGFFYRRSITALATANRLARENARLLAASREEARRDALTGLRNRRALVSDLGDEISRAAGDRPLLLALFDLDGFKQYNDTFGHPAGDTLLTRLGERLEESVAGKAISYRMGGDEFCILASVSGGQAQDLVHAAADALTETGDAFEVGCSYGVVRIPADADAPTDALRVADQRMYEHKAGRSSARRQTADVLLQVLSERSAELHEHLNDVAELARACARDLDMSAGEAERVELAAALHDVGKTAIPDAILNKPAQLDPHEWEFIRNHTLIGERIVRAAPSLAHTADLVRSSHERFDGSGYPDGSRSGRGSSRFATPSTRWSRSGPTPSR